jgi:glycerophosphoryl diester phosphodiesterase
VILKENLIYKLPRPTIFAHRGASLYAPENTLAAFELAVCQGCDAIELDAKLTSDEHIVVIHDQSVDRTTQSAGKVAEMTLAQIRQLDAGSHFDARFSTEKIPLLSEVLETVGNKTFINIELTNYNAPFDSLPEKAGELVRKLNLTQRVIFSSFNPFALYRVRRALPGAVIGLLALNGSKGWWARSRIGGLLSYEALHPHESDVSSRLIQHAHNKNRRVHAYTINQADVMRRFKGWEIDGIFTDDPILAIQTFRS